MLLAASSPAGWRHLNDHAAPTDLAIAGWLQVQCFFALAVIADDQLHSTAPAVERGRVVDAFGVGLQDHSFWRLPVSIWLADESQLAVEVMANRVEVSHTNCHGVKAMRASPGFGPSNELGGEPFAGSVWRDRDDARLHFSWQADLREVRAERAHRDARDDGVAIEQYEHLSGWIASTSGRVGQELEIVVARGDDSGSQVCTDTELVDEFVLVRANLSEHVCVIRPG